MVDVQSAARATASAHGAYRCRFDGVLGLGDGQPVAGNHDYLVGVGHLDRGVDGRGGLDVLITAAALTRGHPRHRRTRRPRSREWSGSSPWPSGLVRIDPGGAQGLQQHSQGLVFTKASPVYQTLDFGYLAWHLGPDGGDPVTSGFDVAIVGNDVIAELYTVITK